MRDSAYDVLNPRCPTQQVLDRIASKWTMLVILALSERPQRYADLQRRVKGVTKKMLTQTLRALERDGLVERRVFQTVPVQTEYELTALGRSLADAVATIRGWAYDNMDGIAGARRRFDDRAPSTAEESVARRTCFSSRASDASAFSPRRSAVPEQELSGARG